MTESGRDGRETSGGDPSKQDRDISGLPVGFVQHRRVRLPSPCSATLNRSLVPLPSVSTIAGNRAAKTRARCHARRSVPRTGMLLPEGTGMFVRCCYSRDSDARDHATRPFSRITKRSAFPPYRVGRTTHGKTRHRVRQKHARLSGRDVSYERLPPIELPVSSPAPLAACLPTHL